MTQEIVEIAREKLDITNDKLYDALYDHIAFAIERLKMGLPIDNPFIGEIAIMCSREFEVAEIAAKLIRREVDVDIGEPGKGLHRPPPLLRPPQQAHQYCHEKRPVL